MINQNKQLPKGWEMKMFEDCLEKVVYTKKIQRKDFLENGEFPIISQEQDFINGYWNNSEDLFKVSKPIVIFGDHTKVLKLIDFDFVLGADGVKILQTKSNIDPRYFYYILHNINLGSLGYARHYRLLKELEILIPPLEEQKRIVAILDEAFTGIDQAKANIEKNLKNAKELFESYLQGVFENKGEDWEEKTLGEVCDLSAGGDVPKNDLSKIKTEKHSIPIYANGEKNDGLYGYTSSAKVLKPSITVSARGTIGYSIIRLTPFFPIVRLVVITPKDLNRIELNFLQYAINTIDFKHSGSSIPQLTVPMIKDYVVPFPSVNEQKQIVQKLDALQAETKKLEQIYKQKIEDLEELKKSILQKAFTGELSNGGVSE